MQVLQFAIYTTQYTQYCIYLKLQAIRVNDFSQKLIIFSFKGHIFYKFLNERYALFV